MKIEKLPPDKRREIEVGRAFIRDYNESEGTSYEIDPSYWDADPDPAPDIRFVEDGREPIFAEVVKFGDEGEEGFRKAAGQARLLVALTAETRARGMRDLMMTVVTDTVPRGNQLPILAASIALFAQELQRDVADRRIRIERDGFLVTQSRVLLEQVESVSLTAVEADHVICMSGSGAIQLRPVEWLREALEKKRLMRYEARTHLLVDNQGWASQSADLQLALGGEEVSVEGFDAVWFVSTDEGPGATLRLDAPR